MKSDKPILELMDNFLANQDIRENSRKKYRDNLHFFIHWLTINTDLNNIQRSDIIRYKQYLIDSGRSPMTVDNYLVSVRQFFKYLEEAGIHDNVAAGVHSPKHYRGYRKEHLSPEQVNKLLSSVNRETITGQRDYAIINLMVRTGMRCIEVARADVRDLRKEDGQWIICLQGKGHWEKDRILGLTDKVVKPIADYVSLLHPDSPMFLNHAFRSNRTRITTLTISKIIKKYLRDIGIDSKKISAHSLRHTAAITALMNGADILHVQSMLGHKNIETTMIYQRSIEEERSREGNAVRLLDKAFDSNKNHDKKK